MPATNSISTYQNVAREALMLLENNLVLGKLVYRGYEDEFSKKSNGYKPGATIKINKPAKYTWRSGRTASPQDSTEKTMDMTLNIVGGVDLQFSSDDLTLKVADFNKRYLDSAMLTVATEVDRSIAAEAYKSTWNWVGTPGQLIDSYADLGKAPQRLDEMSVPASERVGILSPADNWALIPNLAGSFINDVNKSALQKAKLPLIGNIDMYGTQSVQGHTVGPLGGTPLVNGANQNVTYDGTNAQSLITDGWTAAAANRLKRGDVFNIAGVYAVNPVSKQVLPYLQQFVVNADVDSSAGGALTANISPAIITSGAYQTVSAAPADNAAITVLGTASTIYPQNMVFHKNAFALAMVPMEKPEGAVKCYVESRNGLAVRIIAYYDGVNDLGNWRLDVLGGVKAVFPDLAARVSGTA
ncbi:P22 phage major capsid protein family protein [Xanthobacteraceae bacterium Astr-EGSB]|uniref:P22 phage major capsid protein family protein n=1 Tax=Astrobacterium formosum TaxID=3069710 RepID=UPI0027B6FB02|nr:P22 phage major capsid protein family protein [Xanthobacteraceae bacterium Astr-EGSB]